MFRKTLVCTGLLSLLVSLQAFGQLDLTNRSTVYGTFGLTGATNREFNELLSSKGLSPTRNGYMNFGLGFQTRYNDFLVGFELFQNVGQYATFNDFTINQRSTRFYANVGYALTEEGRFQFLHYLSLGAGFLNFQMLRDTPRETFGHFLDQPQQGFILRDGDIHRGTSALTGFLTEIGFQASYDFFIPGRGEMLEVITRFGYAFSPFENSWEMAGMSFNNLMSGAFFRMGLGLTLPDQNFFYKDATLGVYFLYGPNFTAPEALNEALEDAGFEPVANRANNFGMRIMGESKQFLYAIDIYNSGHSGVANSSSTHTLNFTRMYLSGGRKFFEWKNFELGGLLGLGYANLRYTLLAQQRPEFPVLFEEPFHDGYVRTSGLALKPETSFLYGIPLTKSQLFNVVVGLNVGLELPIGSFDLLDVPMGSYVRSPYAQLVLGLRP
ncbi:MAG: hypothetical protein ACXIT9_11320 [Nitritalea sp.]